MFRQAERVDPALPARSATGAGRSAIVHEGWAFEVPGSFDEHLAARGVARGRARPPGDAFAATVTQTSNGMPMSADRFLTKVAGDLGRGRPAPRGRRACSGRARVTSDASSGLEVAVLEGFSAVTGSGAAMRVEFEHSEDWQWAVDLWRSLRPA